jgi:alkanesulfonate monooxygenase SsuD/methylene tetrahydromethanopterin reductase-like flavin-dependent oxidoreductase (luciferase family)
VTGLWRTPVGETFDFSGSHYALEGAPALPKPRQEPVPIIIGGNGPRRTPALAARYATEFNIGFRSEPEIADAFARVRAACESIDRNPTTLKLSVALPTIAADDDQTLARRALATGRALDQFRNGTNICGDAEEIAEKVHRLVDLGAQRIYFQTVDMRDLDQTAYLGTEVLPLLPR